MAALEINSLAKAAVKTQNYSVKNILKHKTLFDSLIAPILHLFLKNGDNAEKFTLEYVLGGIEDCY